MVVIKLVFKIIDTFGLMDHDDQEIYLVEAKKDWSETLITDVDGKEVQYDGFKKFLQMVKKLERNWLFSVAISIASIFIIRAISEYLSPSNPVDEFRRDIR